MVIFGNAEGTRLKQQIALMLCGVKRQRVRIRTTMSFHRSVSSLSPFKAGVARYSGRTKRSRRRKNIRIPEEDGVVADVGQRTSGKKEGTSENIMQ